MLVILLSLVFILLTLNYELAKESTKSKSSQSVKPPVYPPNNILINLTQNGIIPIEYFYVDDTNNGTKTHYKFPEKRMQLFIKGSDTAYNKIMKQFRISQVPFDQLYIYFAKDYWVYLATLKYYYHIKLSNDDNNHINIIPKESLHINSNSQVKAIVFGSQEPWIETWLLHLGVSDITTLEYNYLTYEHKSIKTVSYDNFENFLKLNENSFDIAVSISSFDHDGLGRYADPINPNGDIDAMNIVKKLLKHDGLFFFSVPIGPDVIVWNLHRRYGKKRLPLLLDGWNIIDRIGWNENKLVEPENYRKTYEPIFVLRPQIVQFNQSIYEQEL